MQASEARLGTGIGMKGKSDKNPHAAHAPTKLDGILSVFSMLTTKRSAAAPTNELDDRAKCGAIHVHGGGGSTSTPRASGGVVLVARQARRTRRSNVCPYKSAKWCGEVQRLLTHARICVGEARVLRRGESADVCHDARARLASGAKYVDELLGRPKTRETRVLDYSTGLQMGASTACTTGRSSSFLRTRQAGSTWARIDKGCARVSDTAWECVDPSARSVAHTSCREERDRGKYNLTQVSEASGSSSYSSGTLHSVVGDSVNKVEKLDGCARSNDMRRASTLPVGSCTSVEQVLHSPRASVRVIGDSGTIIELGDYDKTAAGTPLWLVAQQEP
ncbi:hypothetical protein BJV74DRAFT_987951 [Russula compacta]|nr:hypothetical protein BJV74DRAFT_987951 [Russula compacta]